ncbi:MAG: peptidase S41 [Ignavibacteriae bacterium]|nr:MAG: peptidase S41 [Ignavibacteriota bacterium]
MKKLSSVLFIILLLLAESNFAQISARLLQTPDVSKTQVAFSYGGDIWIAPKAGGLANKLTSADGFEGMPHFSPDGKQIAFSANYDGNTDVYIVPSKGGIPKRITFHGMNDRVIDWTPDGKYLIFASSRKSGKQRFNQFYKISANGGLAEKLPIPFAEFGSLSPDGKQIAFTPRTRVYRTWKRYRGGMASNIYTFNLENYKSKNITNNDANNELPMWHKNKIYFLSDNGPKKRSNIWSYNLDTKQLSQITNFVDFDIHFPAVGSNDMVFEAGGKLYVMDLTTEKYNEINIDVVTDESTLMAKSVNPKNLIQNVSISYDGNRAILEARGEIFSVPAEKGPVYNLSQTSGVAERYPAWSPNGKYVAYWSDKTGEYELTIRDFENNNKERTITSFGSGYRYRIYWSPDSKKLSFIDNAMDIYVVDVKSKKVTKVDHQLFLMEFGLRNFAVNWSPDSRYIVYGKNLPNKMNAIAIYDTKNSKLNVVTKGFYNDAAPVFDPEGKYLYFLTNRSFKPVYSDFDNTWVYPNATQIAVVPLTNEITSPLAPENDSTTVKKEEAKKDKKEDDSKDKDEKKKDKVETKIEFADFEERLEILPIDAGNYGNLTAVKGKVIYQKYPNRGSASKERPIKFFDFKERKEKDIVSDANGYMLSADGSKMLVINKRNFYVVKTDAGQKLEKAMPIAQMEMIVIPQKEWKQIFNDAWRLERDFFYDPNMHGVDWNGVKKQYSKLLENAVTRWDVNYIIGEMIGEINASHAYRGGGDAERAKRKPVGYLGIDWGKKDGKYFVKRIVKGASWDSEVRAAIDKSGLKIKEGDFILAVNNIPLNTNKEPYAAFQGYANETISLTVNNKPDMDGAWEVLIKPLKDETRLRNLDWIENNRKRVEEASNGKIGYVYVPSTGVRDGQYELVRMFYPQMNKQGLIVDERFNNGGQIPDRFIELLNRKPLAYWAVRDGATWQWPPVGHFGAKAMLINGWSGSGGDAFPDYFRKTGLGKLIGSRTWGGLIGISGAPSLIDGGYLTVPTFRMYDPDGKWFKEGYGVDPDIEVEEDMTALAKGKDTQLEKAIEQVMKELKENPNTIPKQPPYEKR